MMVAALMLTLATLPMPKVEPGITVDQLQADFERAVTCQQIEGRNVWKGKLAFFIESYSFPDDRDNLSDVVGADAVLVDDNDPETIKEFETACTPTETTRGPAS